MRHLGQARLGVAHGRGIVAVHIAEVALPVDQRIALGKVLGQTHQRVVHRLVAVRMKLADHIADDTRALLESSAGVEPQLPHRIEQAPMDRLEPVARVRQRASGNGGERVLEITFLQRVAQRDLFDPAVARGNQLLAHGQELPTWQAMNKQ